MCEIIKYKHLSQQSLYYNAYCNFHNIFEFLNIIIYIIITSIFFLNYIFIQQK